MLRYMFQVIDGHYLPVKLASMFLRMCYMFQVIDGRYLLTPLILCAKK